jgi:hypothetical protein
MKRHWLALLAMVWAVCAATTSPRRARDYFFDVTGVVTAEDGSPLPHVEVTLQVDAPIYEGVAPVNSKRIVTDKGAFIFKCITHAPSINYTVTARSEGFQAQGLTGSVPPDAHLQFRLKRVNVNDDGSTGRTNH